jgi:hypothetical protein
MRFNIPHFLGDAVSWIPPFRRELERWALEVESGFAIAQGAIRANRTFRPAIIPDVDAENNSIYYSTDAAKLVYKDSGGVVNALY